MKHTILKTSEFISYFDKENHKGGTVVRRLCNNCKKKICKLHNKVDTIELSVNYIAN